MIRSLFIAIAAALALSSFNVFAAVDVNRATQAELESVKGIGPALSGKILEARKTGEFRNWDDLVQRVSGVGPGNAARLSSNGLTVGGSNFDGSNAKPAPKRSADKAAQKTAEKTQP